MSANIFELLNDEAVSRKQKKPAKEEAKSQPQKSAKKADTVAPKKAAAPAKAKEANKPAQKGSAGGNKGKGSTGGQRKGGAGGRVTGSGGAIDAVEKKNRASNRREISKDRNRDNHYKSTKDKLATDGTRGKRTYERRSGTGRPANENKKGGAGRGNWGRNDGTEQIKADVVDADNTTEVAKTEETETREDKEDDKSMTLEEYRKSQASVRVKAKAKKARQANEGEDESKWADFTPLSKEDESANEKPLTVTKEKQTAAQTQENKKTKKKNVKKVALEDILNTRSGSNNNNNSNSKPRGRGRGAGQGADKKPARGGKRGDKPGQANKELALDDDSSFPALG